MELQLSFWKRVADNCPRNTALTGLKTKLGLFVPPRNSARCPPIAHFVSNGMVALNDDGNRAVSQISRPSRRSQWVYYLLAALNVATIGMGLSVTRMMSDRYQRSIEIDRLWSRHVRDFANLRDLAALVDAPGRDVFDDLDAENAASRTRNVEEIFNRKLAEVRGQVDANPKDANSAAILADLDVVGSEAAALVQEQRIVYDYIQKKNLVLAASHKESLTRHFNKVNFAISALLDDATQMESARLEQENAAAASLQKTQWIGTGLIIFLVSATTFYGHLLFVRIHRSDRERLRLYDALPAELQTRRAAQEDLERVHAELERAHEQLEFKVQQRTSELRSTNTELPLQIVDRQKAEEQLRLREERHREVFENASDMIFTVDRQGWLTSLNRAGRELTGVNPETQPVNFADLVSETYRPVVQELLADMPSVKPQLRPFVIVNREDHRLKFEMSISPVMHDGKVSGLHAVARNVTERERLEDQLRQSQKMDAVGRLAGGVAHDFNNLLGVIAGYSELISVHVGLPSPVVRHAEEINKTARRAASLSRQLLTFSRKQGANPAVVNLNGILSDSMSMLRPLIEAHIDISMHLSPDLGNVKVDAGQIEQVLVNLAVNARDAMPDGGKLIVRTRNFEWRRTGDPLLDAEIQPGPQVVLEVSDTGVGMAEQVRARMFDPFFTTKETGKGTGLGLSIVYGIVKQSGGHISVYSEPNKGTTVRIYLPRVNAPVEVLSGYVPVQFGGAQSQTVLLVEDEETLRRMTAFFLNQLGYRVLEAGNGEEAMAVAERHRGSIDVVLTDVIMPRLDGFELYKKLSKKRTRARFLFMSGYADDVVAAHEEWVHEAPFIQKPFGLSDLDSKLKELLPV